MLFALLGAASVLSFIKLGKRVFEFLSPTAVSSKLASDIATAVNAAGTTGLLANDRSIQSHHQRVAARNLDAWEEMVSVSIGRSQSASALKEIGQNTVSLLHWYSEAKLPIPKTSQWFERTFDHPSYFLTRGRKLELASQIGWMPPDMEPDQLWLEKRVGEIIQQVVMALLEKGSSRLCAEILDSFDGWIVRSAHQFRVREMEMGFEITSRIGAVAGSRLARMHEGTDRDRLYGLAVLDSLAQAVPNAAGSLNQRLDTLSLHQMLGDASKAAIDESQSLGEFPPNLRANVESFRSAHAFEKDVEGSTQTPSWFVQHHVARLLSEDVKTTFESLLNAAEQWLPSQAKSLREEGTNEGTTAVIQRGLESVFKLEASAEKAASTLDELKQRRAGAVGEEWPNVNPNEWQERLRMLRLTLIRELVQITPLTLIRELVQITPLLPTTPPEGNLPDSFGFAYTILCDATINMLQDMDATTFKTVYPVLVPSALKAHDRVKAELAKSSIENALILSADVMLDVIEVSGYAYLWKFALGENDFWNSVTTVWDVVLSTHKDPVHLVKIIALEREFHQSQLATTPRSTIRWQWRERIQRMLEDKGFAPNRSFSGKLPRVIAIDPVASSYIRNMDFLDARNLMLSEYIMKRPEAQGVQLPRGVKKLRRGASGVSANRADGGVEGHSGVSGGVS